MFDYFNPTFKTNVLRILLQELRQKFVQIDVAFGCDWHNQLGQCSITFTPIFRFYQSIMQSDTNPFILRFWIVQCAKIWFKIVMWFSLKFQMLKIFQCWIYSTVGKMTPTLTFSNIEISPTLV